MLRVIHNYFIELENALIRERQNARTDQLTKLPNRLAFEEDAERLYALAMRHAQPLSMIVLDVDYFKSVNDNFGHRTGDEVIKLVAEQIQSIIRKGDIAVRWGGEEFVVLLPQTDLAGCEMLAERLRLAIEQARMFGPAGQEIRVTASFGCSQLRCIDTTCGDLFERADQAMYQAKKNGRNQVHTSMEIVLE